MGLLDVFGGDEQEEEQHEAGGLSESFQEEEPLQQETPVATNDWHLPKFPFGDDEEEKKPTASQRAYPDHPEREHTEGPMHDRQLKREEDEKRAADPAYDKHLRHGDYKARMHKLDEKRENYHEPNVNKMERMQDAYHAISSERPDIADPLRRLMAGHAFGEQPGSGVCGWNYFGEELSTRWEMPADNVHYTRAYRSATIWMAELKAEPDMFIDLPGFPTIEQQVDKGERNAIYCLAWAPRPFYVTLQAATKRFVGMIQYRLSKLKKSGDQALINLAERAESGDAHAYAKMVEVDRADLGIKPYNGRPEYGSVIEPHLRASLTMKV